MGLGAGTGGVALRLRHAGAARTLGLGGMQIQTRLLAYLPPTSTIYELLLLLCCLLVLGARDVMVDQPPARPA
jgi:hypothetical protein